jgi:glycosyltransferase involved in cell wall biosynthesis
VLNSEHLAHRFAGQLSHQRTLVVRPHVAGDDYATKPGEMVTLVNSNRDKGGELIDPLARALPDLGFLVVEGAYGEQIRPTAANVEWLPMQPPTAMRDAVYARSRVVLMPSASESWGRVAVEAMSSGIPVVAHPTPGLIESLGEFGIFADRADIAQWVEALTRLRNARTWNAASRKARARAQEVEAMTRADVDAFVDTVSAMPRRIR